ncbi:MAG: L,D-transpeptidase family protein [Planctomycetota bacterium]
MGSWKDDQKAAEILSGNIVYPRASYRLYALAALTLLTAVVAAVVLLRHNGSGKAAAAAQPAPASAEASAEEPRPVATPAVNGNTTAAVPEPELIVLPPIVLGEQPGGGAVSGGGAMTALAEARRIEAGAASDPAALEKARLLYQQALDSGSLEEKEQTQCLARLTELTNKVVLDPRSPCGAPAAVFHKVEPGDSVEKIARKYKVNQGQLKRLNQLNDKLVVRLGETLKVLPGPVLYRVNRARLHGTLYIDGVFIRRYAVAVGPDGATPPGLYTVERKVTNPDWYCEGKRIPFGDPANILGSRWMALATTDGTPRAEGLGIHGTTKPESVPGRESKGCVRMLNNDAEELYDFMPQGGKAEITD